MADFLYGPPAVYPGWTAFGVTGLTDALMAERADEYMNSLLKRLETPSPVGRRQSIPAGISKNGFKKPI
ncbi:hypothetical protein [Paenibacillus sp. MMS18-CY102]|uniref:hypothetical protein n=1 Tax=Paenibacillus sp. MMS18-CY102 TaxID=2682849 RepID=UPI0013656781|nr:hypothetical protein [Paenibacillus sp. MMS18-CY102]MWC29410.1 hypothetical protein [Paenibacillus sp. MMS18-CY102]